MYKLRYYNLQEFCRICLKRLRAANTLSDGESEVGVEEESNGEDGSYNLYSKPQLALLLKIFLSLDVYKQPSKFPNSICGDCFSTVIQYERFRKVAQHSEQTLECLAKEAFGITQRKNQQEVVTDADDQLLLPELLVPNIIVKPEPIEIEAHEVLDRYEELTRKTMDSRKNATKQNFFFIKSQPHKEKTAIVEEKCIGEVNRTLSYKVDDVDQVLKKEDWRNFGEMPTKDNDDHQILLKVESMNYENKRVNDNDNQLKRENDNFTIDMTYSSSLEENIDKTFTSVGLRKNGSLRRILKCNRCDKQAYKLVYLEAHIRAVHEGHDKPFLCRKCNKSFKRYSGLHDHLRTSHPTDLIENALNAVTELICQVCERQYSSKRALDQHLKRHAQIKEHVCKHCGVGKVTRTELLTHLRTHELNMKKFKCSLCPQLFNHKNAISRHIRVVHEGERRFKCAYCSKSFGTRNSQERHQLLHTDVRPFSCDVCQKSFTHLDRLSSHLRSHDKNSWRYVCRYCSKPCISRQNLTDHEHRHEGDKPHICVVCSRGFATIDDLTMHMRLPCSERHKFGTTLSQAQKKNNLKLISV